MLVWAIHKEENMIYDYYLKSRLDSREAAAEVPCSRRLASGEDSG